MVTACVFNEGKTTILKITDTMGVKIGQHALNYAKKVDRIRVQNAELRSTKQSKEARLQRKNDKMNEELMFQEVEGLLYDAGIDD